MIPSSSMLTYVPLRASNPVVSACSRTWLTITAASNPAFEAMMRSGSSNALRTINAPSFSSSSSLSASITLCARSNATPPPATIPSSTAARVACKASSIRSFFSFISVSVAAPTRITATPPASLARRSCNFSLS